METVYSFLEVVLGKIQAVWPAFSFGGFIACLGIVVVGLFLKGLIRRKMSLSKLTPNKRELVHRLVGYSILFGTAALALNAVGFKLGVVLGAAGVLTVGLSFASQNTIGNMLSGFFLMLESPFQIGDWIQVAGTEGTVVEMRVLSVSIRTFDYRLVRVPATTVFMGVVVNMHAFERRRVNIGIGVGYGEDLQKVKRVLFEVADQNEFALKDPGPVLFAGDFADSSVNLTFGVWVPTASLAAAKFALQDEVLKAFAEHNIEIPFPYRQLVAGNGEPVRVLHGALAATGTDGAAGGQLPEHESGNVRTRTPPAT